MAGPGRRRQEKIRFVLDDSRTRRGQQSCKPDNKPGQRAPGSYQNLTACRPAGTCTAAKTRCNRKHDGWGTVHSRPHARVVAARAHQGGRLRKIDRNTPGGAGVQAGGFQRERARRELRLRTGSFGSSAIRGRSPVDSPSMARAGSCADAAAHFAARHASGVHRALRTRYGKRYLAQSEVRCAVHFVDAVLSDCAGEIGKRRRLTLRVEYQILNSKGLALYFTVGVKPDLDVDA